MSLSADFVPDPNTERGAKYAKYADKYNFEFSKQYELSCIQCVTIARKQLGHSTTLHCITKTLTSHAQLYIGLNGSGTVIFEVRGQFHSLGQMKKVQLVKAVETSLYGIINGVTDGPVENLSPAEYDNIPRTSYRPGI